jgi:GT2 family glycosyltransferase
MTGAPTEARAMDGSTVSAIVVTYHTGPILLECLAALQGEPGVAETILVDNGNPPDVAGAAAAYSKVRRVGDGRNIGFGAGVNLGARHASGDYFLIVNPDAVIGEGCVRALGEGLVGRRRPTIAGGRLLGSDGREQRGARRRPLTLATALGAGLRRFGLPIFPPLNLNDEPLPASTIAVGAVSGALMYVSRADFEALSGFDEGYFLHVEDVDLCRRAIARGGEAVFVPFAMARHIGATSRIPRREVQRHKADSLIRYFTINAAQPFERLLVRALAPLIRFALVAGARKTPPP